jgi:hypothetical protein
MREDFDAIRVGAPAEEALTSDLDDISMKIRQAIAERIWEEFPKLHHDNPEHQKRMADMAEERGREFYEHNFWPMAF